MYDIFEILPFALIPNPAWLVLIPLLICALTYLFRGHKHQEAKLWDEARNISLVGGAISAATLLWAYIAGHIPALSTAFVSVILCAVFLLISFRRSKQ